MEDKWFYPLQKEIKEYLDSHYFDYECNYQVVTKDRVFEGYTCIISDYHEDESLVNNTDILLFEIRNHPVRSAWFVYRYIHDQR